MIKSSAQYWAGNQPRVTARRAWRPVTRGRPTSWLGHGLAAQPSGANSLRGPLQRARDGTVACSSAARRWLDGGKVAGDLEGGHREGAGQGGEGRGAPERRVDSEAAQTASDGGVQRRRGCFGGRRRAWRGPAAPVWKGEERFSSNSGNGEARRALTGEGEDSGGARQNPTRG
jgi:hypothetical protein